MYSSFVESLKLLIITGILTEEKLKDLLTRNLITLAEYKYITNKESVEKKLVSDI